MKFEQGLDRAERRLSGFQRKAAKLSKVATRLGGFLGIASGGVAAGLGALAQNAIAAGDRIEKLSERLGASTEALSQYRLVAERGGVTFETFTMGLQRMTRRVAEAATGTGEAQDALHELGLDAQALVQMRPEDQFEAIAEAMQEVDNQGHRVRLAMRLFDSEGVSLIQTMGDGAAGIRKLREEADAMGLTLSTKTAKAMALASDANTNLTQSISGLGNVLAGKFAGVFSDFVNGLARMVQKVSEFIQTTGLGKETLEQFGDSLDANIAKTKASIDAEERKIAALQKEQEEYKRLLGMVDDAGNKTGIVVLGPATRVYEERLLAIIEKTAAARTQLAGFGAELRKLEASRPAGEGELAIDVNQDLANRQAAAFELLRQASILQNEQREKDEQEHQQRLMDQWMAYSRARVKHVKDTEDKNKKILEKYAAVEKQLRASVFTEAVGLLSALGSKNKEAAIAAIAVSKGLAIAQTIQSTHAAAMRAFAELGPIAGGPVAAKIETLGNLKVGLIAATGLAQIANVGGGGGGVSASPLDDLERSGNVPELAPAAREIHIHIEGFASQELIDEHLIPEIRAAVSDRDQLIITTDSRNGRDIVASAAA